MTGDDLRDGGFVLFSNPRGIAGGLNGSFERAVAVGAHLALILAIVRNKAGPQLIEGVVDRVVAPAAGPLLSLDQTRLRKQEDLTAARSKHLPADPFGAFTEEIG